MMKTRLSIIVLLAITAISVLSACGHDAKPVNEDITTSVNNSSSNNNVIGFSDLTTDDKSKQNTNVKISPDASLDNSTINLVKQYNEADIVGCTEKFNKSEDLTAIGIDPSAPNMKNIYYYCNSYIAETNDGFYISKNLADWKKMSLPIPQKEIKTFAGDDENLILLADKLYYSSDGVTWHSKAAKALNFPKSDLKNVLFTKGTMILRVFGLRNESSLSLGNYEVFITETYIEDYYNYYDIYSSDFHSCFAKSSEDDSILISHDGIKWTDTKIKGLVIKLFFFSNQSYLDTGNEYYRVYDQSGGIAVSKIDIKQVKGLSEYVKANENNLGSGLIHKIEYSNSEILNNLTMKSVYNTDFMLLKTYLPFSSGSMIGNNIFFMSKYGVAIYIDYQDYINGKTDFKWCGLYNRKPVSVISESNHYSNNIKKLVIRRLGNYYINIDYIINSNNQVILNYSNNCKSWKYIILSDLSELQYYSDLSGSYDFKYEIGNIRSNGEKLFICFKKNSVIFSYKLSEYTINMVDEIRYTFLKKKEDVNGRKYLGLNGGDTSIEAARLTNITGLLMLNKSADEVYDVAWGGGYYFAFACKKYPGNATKDSIYRSTNGVNWELIKYNLDVTSFYGDTFYGDNNGLILDNENGLYFTKDGVNWEHIFKSDISRSGEIIYEFAYANGILCIVGDKSNQLISDNTSPVKFVYLSKKIYRDIQSDGDYFGATMVSNQPLSEKKDLISISKDGVHWTKTQMTAGGNDGEGDGEISLYKSYDKHYIYSRTANADDYEYWTYEFYETSDSSFKSKLLTHKDSFWGDNDDHTAFPNTSLVPSLKDSKSMAGDLPIIDNFCNIRNWLENINGKIFLFGDYGYICCSDGAGKWEWAGLYPRKPLTYSELASDEIGGFLGIRMDSGKLWFQDGDFLGVRFPTRILTSDDGINWSYVKSINKKAYVKNGKVVEY